MTWLVFVLVTAGIAVATWWITRRDNLATADGVFLAGRSLTWPVIAGSLLLTNLSTEQLVGLNGASFIDGLAVMVWEVVAVVALVVMALFFLPRLLKHGVTTVPQFLEIRFDSRTQVITNLVFLVAYATILLPIVLYTGAIGLITILDVQTLLGFESEAQTLWAVVATVGLIGAAYALFGGLKAVAVSDLFNGIGLLIGGTLITVFGLIALGDGNLAQGFDTLIVANGDRFNSLGATESSVPIGTVFSGILLLNLFYWTTNQQIIQRTLGAKSLAEGQKGILATGFLKLFGPVFLVVPGMIAFALFADRSVPADAAYGSLVREVLPSSLTGFFAAVMTGAILSSFNSALNSTCTLFSLGPYRTLINPNADSGDLVRAGRRFGWAITVVSIVVAPMLAGQASIFAYLQKMNGIYFIPIFAVVLTGLLTTNVPARAAKLALAMGFVGIAAGYFVPPLARIVESMHEYQFLGIVFTYLLIYMLVHGALHPAETTQRPDSPPVDLTPWRHARVTGMVLLGLVLAIYVGFADTRSLA